MIALAKVRSSGGRAEGKLQDTLIPPKLSRIAREPYGHREIERKAVTKQGNIFEARLLFEIGHF